MESTLELVGKINALIINPLIMLMFAAALVLFLWGLAQFLMNGEDADKQEAKRKIVWGIIGIFIMVSVYGILNLILNTFELDTPKGYESVLN